MKSFKSSWFVLFALLSFVLAACGGGGDPAPGTSNAVPILTAQAVDNVSPTQGHYNGLANPNGNTGLVYFQRSTDSAMAGAIDLLPKRNIGSGVTAVPVDYTDTTVASATRYYVWLAFDKGAGDITYSNIVTYVSGSPAALPTAQTWAPSNVTISGYQRNGSANTQGLVGEWWMEQALDNTYINPIASAHHALPASLTSVSVSDNVTGLAPSTTRYYRVVVQTSAGVPQYGAWVPATTNPVILPADVVTLGATNITQNGARLNGTVNPHGLAGTGGFDYTTDLTHASYTSTTPVSVGSGNTAVPILFDLTGQAAGTTIDYRAFGITSAGTIPGTWLSFTTQVATGLAPSINGLSVGTPFGDNVSVALTVDPQDPTAVTDAWVESSQDNNVWTPTAHQSVNPGAPATRTFSLTSLPAGVTYIRGRASNSWGEDTYQMGDRVTVTQDNGTLNLLAEKWDTIYLYTEFDVPVMTMAGNDLWNPISLPPVGYKLYMMRNWTLYAVVNDADNNVFRLTPGCTLNIGGVSSSAAGRLRLWTSGSGFTTEYQPPNAGGAAWNLMATVYDSKYDNGAVFIPTGSEFSETRLVVQNEFLVYFASDSVYTTVYGIADGSLVEFRAAGGTDPLWTRTFCETWSVDPSGTTLTGTVEETWQARSGTTTAYVRATVTGWR